VTADEWLQWMAREMEELTGAPIPAEPIRGLLEMVQSGRVLPPYVVEHVLWTVGELRKDVAALSAKLTKTERAEDDARRRIEDLRLKADRAARDLERAREDYWSETARLQAQIGLLRPGGELLARAAAAVERLEALGRGEVEP